MYTYYNAHPKGLLVGDCVKRAISKAANMDYMEVQRELNRHKKVTGCANYYDHNHGTHYVEHVLHGVKLSFPAVKGKPRMNGERFCKAYPKGHYILSMAGHLSCCIDGVIYDTWDCSDKCVYCAYKVEPETKYFKILKDNDTYCAHVTNETETYISAYMDKKRIEAYVQCLRDLGFKERSC